MKSIVYVSAKSSVARQVHKQNEENSMKGKKAIPRIIKGKVSRLLSQKFAFNFHHWEFGLNVTLSIIHRQSDFM